GEEPERPAAGGADELDELALGVLAGTFPSRGGQVAGAVEDALASVVERGADVDAPPARRAAVAARPGRAVTVGRRGSGVVAVLPARRGALGAGPRAVVRREVVEQADAERAGHGVEAAAERERRGGEDGRPPGEQLGRDGAGDVERGEVEARGLEAGAAAVAPQDVLALGDAVAEEP